MFVSFLLHLRRRGLPVGTIELLALLEALQRGLVGERLDQLYTVARALLVKRAEHLDLYDQAFAEFFKDSPFDLTRLPQLTDELLSWLEDPRALRPLDAVERAMLEAIDLEELRRTLDERLREQQERHDGGSRWVGTGGTSPFGHSGQHAAGVRVGGEGKNRSAVQIATERRFQNLRKDLVLDVRQIGVALRKLRVLTREGAEEELDLDATVDATARSFGDLELRWRAPRHNRVKLLLLMDVGGSMTAYARVCSQLFSAAHQASHFKRFESYYFHNCVYHEVYTDMSRRQAVPTQALLRQLDDSWRCIIVGDAAMAPTELMSPGGAIDLYTFNQEAGLTWLQRIKAQVPRAVWLNPDPPRYWTSTYTTARIRQVFPMYGLTLEGLDEAIAALRAGAPVSP